MTTPINNSGTPATNALGLKSGEHKKFSEKEMLSKLISVFESQGKSEADATKEAKKEMKEMKHGKHFNLDSSENTNNSSSQGNPPQQPSIMQ